MLKTYTWPKYAYRQSDEQRSGRPARHPVVVVGAGPIGLTAALDCARRGLDVLIVDDNDTVSVGSRAVCYAKRPLEVWDRIGRRGDGTPTLGERMAERGVSWKLGRVYFRDEPVYTFDLLPEAHHKMPAMVNLQQYHLEEMLVAACEANPRIDLRWKHRVLSLAQRDDHIVLQVETPDGIFCTEAQWVVACDGANSELRRMVGAGFSGQFFQDRFLIADIVMKRDMPAERRFWFDPPFHRGQSVLLHKQPDDVWRVDFQLGWDTDPEVEKQPERVRERVRAALGEDVEFELEWVSVYQFACRRIDRFRHGRVLFAGDAAHQVSPFGARGANTGVQDVDNLAWKLALVVHGLAPEALLDSYHDERAWAADDNLRASTRSTDFITPKSRASRLYRDAVLGLAKTEPFARPEHARRGALRRRDAPRHGVCRRPGARRRAPRLAARAARRRLHAARVRPPARGRRGACWRRRRARAARGQRPDRARRRAVRALRRPAGHDVSDPPRPARGGALARFRQRRHRARDRACDRPRRVTPRRRRRCR